MTPIANQLSLQDFLALPESDERNELFEGKLKPKMSPKYKHATVQGRLFRLLDDWCDQFDCGRIRPEWGVVLRRKDEDWVPVPDLLYVSYERLGVEWEEDEPCPVVPELVIEIISPGQTFGELTHKATDYLLAGVERVWVIDNASLSLTIFRRGELPVTLWSEGIIEDPLLPGLVLPISQLFAKRGA